MARAKYIALLPLSFNDGRAVSEARLARYLDRLYVLADGYTVAGTVTGAYRMKSGAKQVDRCLEIWVVLKRSQEPALKRWLAKIGKDLSQETMYLERTSGAVTFIKPLRKAR
jgi:hypothetical protein